MEYESIKDLIKTIDNSSIYDFELTLKDVHVRMNKGINKIESEQDSPKNTKSVIKNAVDIAEIIEEPITIIPEEKNDIKDGNIVISPMVGTFYESPSPKKPPFVKLGDKIKKGDILCVIEAMKIMNEIVSQYDGEIAEIFVKNEEMVEYNQPLFRIV